MGELNVLDVYNKIKEIKDSRKRDKNKTISIDYIAQELKTDKEVIEGYVNALRILELVDSPDNENVNLL